MRGMRVLLLAGLLMTAAACGRDEERVAERDAARIAADSAVAETVLTPIRSMSLAEVEFGDMAAQRAGDPAIRQYAQTIATDHRALIGALDSIARLHRATLTETRETQELANTARMAHSGLDGLAVGEFDLPFVRAEVESHRLLVDQLDQQLIPAASQPDLRSLLSDIRAMADAHLTRARQLLAQQLGETVEPQRPAGQQPVEQQPRPGPPAEQPPPPPPPRGDPRQQSQD
jgi:putative membrane protein